MRYFPVWFWFLICLEWFPAELILRNDSLVKFFFTILPGFFGFGFGFLGFFGFGFLSGFLVLVGFFWFLVFLVLVFGFFWFLVFWFGFGFVLVLVFWFLIFCPPICPSTCFFFVFFVFGPGSPLANLGFVFCPAFGALCQSGSLSLKSGFGHFASWFSFCPFFLVRHLATSGSWSFWSGFLTLGVLIYLVV